ncbi:alkaline phosphatase family protein [Mycobacterium koreense]|uniref:Alkaline phosphatase family protein n=1 Tax=Mycolicibacillus koreensis TaxID=1069220 RepID=A0A7I7SHM3_9MYCO|nr:nucleotide pyrophosphatase/phosphodiesterase family protein [Mycolicibacillus koreensis]MCV7248480.1 alkaline phosphatase family protein [Mycolicibacillus koreensis]OSC33082.1 alkaline phosphatase family protein [Mycolicibacillus koreensis]BBY55436.1 phosphodiesterase [Mycolicibacillus koreensis]
MPGSICDILFSAAALLGAPEATDRLGLPAPARRVVVLLVDGMGTHLLPAMHADAPTLAAVSAGEIGELRQLECTFPSTTPTSLVSLGTGVSPGQHGVLGFTVNVPGTDRVLIHIFWHDDPPPQSWQPVPTWFHRLNTAGISARAVLPQLLVDSGLTAAAYGGAQFRGVPPAADYATDLLAEIHAGPGLIFGYTSVLDSAGHAHGIGSPAWLSAAAHVDALLTRLVDGLPDDTLLLVTADHGGLNVPTHARVDLDADADLAAGVAVVAGEPRVRYLHTRPGAQADVLATWTEKLAGAAQVYSRDAAIDAGLFGPVRDEFSPRIGDVVAVATGETAILASAHEPPQITDMIGFHGAGTDAEMAIPLIVVAT